MANNRFSRILLRGGTKQELKDINPMLKEREPIVEYDTGRMKIGDGINRYNKLKYVGGGSGGGTPTVTSFSVTKCIDSLGNIFNSGTIPNGATITEIALSYIISATPDELVVYDNTETYHNESYPETLSRTLSITDKEISKDSEYTLTIKYDDTPSSSVAKILFKPYLYYMVSEDVKPWYVDTPSASIKWDRLSSSVSNKKLIINRNNTLSNIDSGDDKYIYIFLPKSIYGTTSPSFKVGDFTGGFMQISNEPLEAFSSNHIIKIANEYNLTDEYYVFRSSNSGLGNKTITIS